MLLLVTFLVQADALGLGIRRQGTHVDAHEVARHWLPNRAAIRFRCRDEPRQGHQDGRCLLLQVLLTLISHELAEHLSRSSPTHSGRGLGFFFSLSLFFFPVFFPLSLFGPIPLQ